MDHRLAVSLSPLDRLDDIRADEKCGHDVIAEAISQHLYGRSYDTLPQANRTSVERAALRAIRGPQTAWMREALTRAYANLDRAMAAEMGMGYAQQTKERRMALAYIGVEAVLAAFVGTLEIDNPFDGPGDVLRVYDAAQLEAKGIR